MILVTACAEIPQKSHKRCTTDAKQAVHPSFTKHLGSPRCSVMHRRDIKTQKSVTEAVSYVSQIDYRVVSRRGASHQGLKIEALSVIAIGFCR